MKKFIIIMLLGLLTVSAAGQIGVRIGIGVGRQTNSTIPVSLTLVPNYDTNCLAYYEFTDTTCFYYACDTILAGFNLCKDTIKQATPDVVKTFTLGEPGEVFSMYDPDIDAVFDGGDTVLCIMKWTARVYGFPGASIRINCGADYSGSEIAPIYWYGTNEIAVSFVNDFVSWPFSVQNYDGNTGSLTAELYKVHGGAMVSYDSTYQPMIGNGGAMFDSAFMFSPVGADNHFPDGYGGYSLDGTIYTTFKLTDSTAFSYLFLLLTDLNTNEFGRTFNETDTGIALYTYYNCADIYFDSVVSVAASFNAGDSTYCIIVNDSIVTGNGGPLATIERMLFNALYQFYKDPAMYMQPMTIYNFAYRKTPDNVATMQKIMAYLKAQVPPPDYETAVIYFTHPTTYSSICPTVGSEDWPRHIKKNSFRIQGSTIDTTFTGDDQYGICINFPESASGVDSFVVTTLYLDDGLGYFTLELDGQQAIDSVDYSDFPSVNQVYLQDNFLTSVNLSAQVNANWIYVEHNRLTEQALDDFAATLPDRTGKSLGNIVLMPQRCGYPQSLTAGQISIIEGKNWQINQWEFTCKP